MVYFCFFVNWLMTLIKTAQFLFYYKDSEQMEPEEEEKLC